MAKIYQRISDLVGRTPLVEAARLEKKLGLKAKLLLKLEYLNPAGSVKDRVAKEMLEDAERRGMITAGATIIEPTSGNTGIGLAAMAVAKGYRAILTMPDTMSVERRNILKAYGAEIVLTPGAEGMKGAIAKAEALAKEIPGSFIPGQFENPANPEAHRKTTGPEVISKKRIRPSGSLPWSRPPLRSFPEAPQARTCFRASAQALCRKFWTPTSTMRLSP